MVPVLRSTYTATPTQTPATALSLHPILILSLLILLNLGLYVYQRKRIRTTYREIQTFEYDDFLVILAQIKMKRLATEKELQVIVAKYADLQQEMNHQRAVKDLIERLTGRSGASQFRSSIDSSLDLLHLSG